MEDNDELEPHEDAENEPSVDYAAKKRRVVRLLLTYSAVLGVFFSLFLPEEDGVLDVIIGLPLLILGVWWCFIDAAERDHRIGGVTRLLLILLWNSLRRARPKVSLPCGNFSCRDRLYNTKRRPRT